MQSHRRKEKMGENSGEGASETQGQGKRHGKLYCHTFYSLLFLCGDWTVMSPYLASQSQEKVENSVCMCSFNGFSAGWLNFWCHCGHNVRAGS